VQFGVLARLHALGSKGQAGVSLGALAQRVGRHPSTVTRDLQPVVKAGLVTLADDASDRRVRTARITAKGTTLLQKAFPLWREAQARVRETLGSDATSDLKRALDQASAALD
jgi:DNA-binding MarR family transcriptional regulator